MKPPSSFEVFMVVFFPFILGMIIVFIIPDKYWKKWEKYFKK